MLADSGSRARRFFGVTWWRNGSRPAVNSDTSGQRAADDRFDQNRALPKLRMSSSNIVPFRCAACGCLFEPSGGGICRSCRRLLCEVHFDCRERSPFRWANAETSSPTNRPICRDCVRQAVKSDAG